MWTYDQATGNLSRDGEHVATGYSGSEPDGKNNPAMQDAPQIGPIPRGKYTILEPFNSPSHGPFAMRLDPSPDNEMHGRAGFLIHGDSAEHPGKASEGCIILPRAVRQQVWSSEDHELEVV